MSEFIDSIYFLEGNQIGTGIAFQRMNQVIIINLGTNFTVSDVYTTSSREKATNSDVWMNGKQEIPFMLSNKGVTAMYAIGIKLGMMPYFADLPANETNEQAVGAENWTSREIFNLREQLLATDVQNGFLLIEKYLMNMLRHRDFSNLEKIKWLGKVIPTTPVEEICRSLGFTRKRLRNEAQYYLGGSVKSIQGIIRLNHTLSAIAHHSDKSLSSLHEYYDQSHFINDFKARTGITPLQYKRLCQQFPEIKYTPNFLAMQKETFLQFIAE